MTSIKCTWHYNEHTPLNPLDVCTQFRDKFIVILFETVDLSSHVALSYLPLFESIGVCQTIYRTAIPSRGLSC